MFFQQPLLLPGLVGLGWMIRQRHPFTLPWLAIYLSLLVPTALHTYSEYGGAAPSGRFGWTAMWLWLVPLGVWIDARSSASRYLRATVMCGLAYQAALAVRWLPNPSALYSRTDDLVWHRTSLFPVSVRYSLPHFYGTSSLDYLPNVVWVLAALLLVATGILLMSPGARRPLRRAWTAAAVAAAMLLPVEPTADPMSDADEERERALDLSLRSIIARRFEAERMTPMSTAAETTRQDPAASAGAVRAAASAPPGSPVVFGPYLDLGPGRYRAVAALRLGAVATGRAARFEVSRNRASTTIATLNIPASHLRDDGEWSLAAITFESTDALEDVEFRIFATPGVDLLIDYVELTPILPHPAAPTPTAVTELPPAP